MEGLGGGVSITAEGDSSKAASVLIEEQMIPPISQFQHQQLRGGWVGGWGCHVNGGRMLNRDNLYLC